MGLGKPTKKRRGEENEKKKTSPTKTRRNLKKTFECRLASDFESIALEPPIRKAKMPHFQSEKRACPQNMFSKKEKFPWQVQKKGSQLLAYTTADIMKCVNFKSPKKI